jgi:hypothetical protein
MQRPTGITILALLYVFGGSLSLAMSSVAVAESGRLTRRAEASGDLSRERASELAFGRNLAFWIGLFGTGASSFKLVAAAGLWTLQPWGRQIALIRATLKLASHLAAPIQGVMTPAHVAGTLVDITVLFYLCRPHVRHTLSGAAIDVRTTMP